MTNYEPSDGVRHIRAQLEHPIIDSDGHLIEFLPLVRDLLVDLADESVAQRFDALVHSGETLQGVSDEMRKRHGITQTPWWGIPTRNTLDRATAMLPRLLYERLDELGLDVAVLYPTYGLIPIHITDDELRQAMAAAFNAYLAEQYAPYADRLIPVACIPTFTPNEALAELEHAVVDLGLRAVMMGGAIPARFPKVVRARSGWTDSATALSTITTRFGSAAPSLGFPRLSTRPARDGAPECRQVILCTTTLATSLLRAN